MFYTVNEYLQENILVVNITKKMHSTIYDRENNYTRMQHENSVLT